MNTSKTKNRFIANRIVISKIKISDYYMAKIGFCCTNESYKERQIASLQVCKLEKFVSQIEENFSS